MTYLSNLAGMLVFRVYSLRRQAESRSLPAAAACFCAGFLAYVLVRNRIYAALPELTEQTGGPIRALLNLNLLQTIAFVLAIYIPALILLTGSISGRRQGFSMSGRDYRSHLAVLPSLWGVLFLIAAPVQWIVPHFLIIGMLEISVGYLVRSVLLLVYTFWAIRNLNNLTVVQAAGTFILSWFTLPLLYLAIRYPTYALPVLCLAIVWMVRKFHRERLDVQSAGNGTGPGTQNRA
jgi:hypothetical protein